MSNYPNQRVNALRKSGRIDDAYQLGKDLLARYPEDLYLRSEVGWVLYDKAKSVAGMAASANHDVRSLERRLELILNSYSQLGLERPDLLFSLLVNVLTRIDAATTILPRFLQWAGLASFRPEDFTAQKGKENDVIYPPLVERVASRVAKALGGSDSDVADKEFAISLIDLALNESQVQRPIWLRYRKALLLAEIGEIQQARELLLPVVREKRGEYWAWHALARVERRRDPKVALALCAKAFAVCHEEGFAVGVLADLAELAVELGRYELAKWSVDRHIAVRQERGWRVSDSLLGRTTTDWYEKSEIMKDSKSVLEDLSAPAEQVLYEGVWQDACFLEAFVGKKGKRLMKVGVKDGSNTVEAVARTDQLGGPAELKAGAPLLAAVEQESDRIRLHSIKRRPDGIEYDCLMEVHGVIDHHNSSKGLASVYVSASKFCLLHYDRFKLAKGWDVGSPVVMRCTHNRGRLVAYEANRSQFKETEFITRISGRLRVHAKGFGFVCDAFVPPALAQSAEDGAGVEVVAVRKPKNRDGTGGLGWKAICILETDIGESPDSQL